MCSQCFWLGVQRKKTKHSVSTGSFASHSSGGVLAIWWTTSHLPLGTVSTSRWNRGEEWNTSAPWLMEKNVEGLNVIPQPFCWILLTWILGKMFHSFPQFYCIERCFFISESTHFENLCKQTPNYLAIFDRIKTHVFSIRLQNWMISGIWLCKNYVQKIEEKLLNCCGSPKWVFGTIRIPKGPWDQPS